MTSMSVIDASQPVVPNSSGAKLIRCLVSVDTSPPAVSTEIQYFPVVAFAVNNDTSFTPLLVSGPVIGWGEVRASMAGAYVYGICLDSTSGVVTTDNKYDSVEDFVSYAKSVVAIAVSDVRREKGWPESTMPNLAIQSTCEDARA